MSVQQILISLKATTPDPSPPDPTHIIEWWDARDADFSTTGAGKLLDTWTGRENAIPLTGSTTTRPVVKSDGTNKYVYFTADYLIAGTFTSGTFQDGEIVHQAHSASDTSVAVANGAQSAGANLRVTGYRGGPGADNTSTWVGQTSGAIFTPSGYPTIQTATNNMVIDSAFTWDRRARSLYVLITRDVVNTATANLWSMAGETDVEYFASGPRQNHWNGSASIEPTHYLSDNLGILFSLANGATDITLGVSAESGNYAYNLNPSGTSAGGRLGAGASGGGSPLSGSFIRAIIAYDEYHDATARAAVMDWLTTLYGATSRSAATYINYVGDSITEGSEASMSYLTAFPARVAQLCSYQPKFSNRGLAGAAVYPSAGIVFSTTVTDTDFSRNAWATNKVLVIGPPGTNDISVHGRTSAQIITDLTNYIADRRTATSGLIVVCCTMINKAGFSSGDNTTKDAVNAFIKSSGGVIDYYVDTQADTRLQDTTDTDYFSTDQIHPNDAGYAVIAGLVQAELLAQSLVT